VIEHLKDLLVRAGATWVLWLLLALSVLSVAVMLDRARVFRTRGGDLGSLVRELDGRLAQGHLHRARECLEQAQTAAALVALAGLAHIGRGRAAMQEAMAAAAGLERSRLERRLLFLGTVGNNAPFVGLLGTVIGVVGAFEALGQSSATAAAAGSQFAPEQVMSTIAEALVATAAGLVVAIPAVAVFNYFQGRLTAALRDAETLGHVVLAYVGEGGQELEARELDGGSPAVFEQSQDDVLLARPSAGGA
jgi:biopolymer transport protein ExbB